MGKLIIQKPGLYTTIQDTGRKGYRKYGVPVSGPMDQQSAGLANLLVNNPPDTPLLEITLIGPEILLEGGGLLVLTGADLTPKLNELKVPLYTPTLFHSGQTLTFGKPVCGVRCYLAIKGGFDSPRILGSASQYAPITGQDKLAKGDTILFQDHQNLPETHASIKADHEQFIQETLYTYPGPELDLLFASQKASLFQNPLTIGENNRMGYQLQPGGDLKNDFSIITSPVGPGTVQLTPSGKLIVLMRDGQVTGGYPRILQLSQDSINRLAQQPTGKQIRFAEA